MEKLSIIFFLLIITFSPNLDYPKDANDIEKVELVRADKSHKHNKTQLLTINETKQLLFILGNARWVEAPHFKPDYHIVFLSKKGETKKLMINKNLVKGYDTDKVYEIRPLEFLLEF